MLKARILTVAFLGAQIGIANAADLVPPPAPPEWTFTLAPYVWAAGLHGDVAQFGLPSIDVDASFADILNHFDLGFMGAGEARYDRFSIATDLMWVKVSAEKNTPLGILADNVH